MTKINMKQIVEAGTQSDDAKMRQYARSLERMLEWRGYSGPDLNTLDGDIETYLGHCPKYDKRGAPLVASIVAAGWKPATYRQYQSDGRRMVEHFNGALAARQERRGRVDEWSVLQGRAKVLSEAGFIDESRLRGLAKITDLGRAAGIEPRDLTMGRIIALRDVAKTAADWNKARRGARLLDDLRDYPTLRDVLPADPIGEVTVKWRAKNEIAEHLEQDMQTWLAAATSSLPENLVTPEAHEMLRTEHSAGSKGVFAAALRSYVTILGKHRNLGATKSLAGLFDPAAIETVLMSWIRCHEAKLPGALSARSLFRYADCLRLSLLRNQHHEGARKISELYKVIPLLKHGKAANEFMSEETKTWCRAMLADLDSVRTFETQHFLYAKRAAAALVAAAAAGFHLVALANNPARMKKLSASKRSAAKKLLRQARMFGVCAAYSAIALEGAPFRRINMLGLMQSGSKQTFFDHAAGPTPYYEIIMPNELLKNGDSLSKRGQSLPPIHMGASDPGNFAVPILKFYIASIRPLFPCVKDSHALFPPLDPKHPHLITSTFDDWLLECSADIGLPMTSHNFRHGVCSIDVNQDPNCLEQLAVLLGDRPETLRKYYAFLDDEKMLRKMQQGRAARRAKYSGGRTPFLKAA